MNRAESPKPPLAPKPKTPGPLLPVATCPASARPGGLHSPNSMPRGPKPPLAPKPRLAAPGGCRRSVRVVSGPGQCSNGGLLCGLGGQRPSLDCSEPEPHDCTAAPRPGPGGGPEDGAGAQGAEGGPDAGADEDAEPPAAPAQELSREGQEGTEDGPADGDEGDSGPGTEEQVSSSEEEAALVKEHNAYNWEDGRPRDGAEGLGSDIILAHVDPCADPEGTELEEEGPGGPGRAAHPDSPARDVGQGAEGAGEESPDGEEASTDAQEPQTAADGLEMPPEACEETPGGEDPASPGEDQESPGEDPESTGEDQESPGEDQMSPGEDHESLGEDHESLGEDHESLGEDHESLGEDHESLGEDHESLGEDHESLGEDHESLGEDHESLGEDHESLGEDHESLGEDHESLGEDPASPGEDPESPGEDPASPGEDQESPGEDPESPGEDQMSPGEDPTSPGEDQGASAAAAQQAEEAPQGGVDAQEEAAEESCQIIPFESNSLDDVATSPAESPYELFPTESTSFCSGRSCPEAGPGRPSGAGAWDGPCGQCESPRGAAEGPAVPSVVVEPEDDSLSNPYVTACPAEPGGPRQAQAESGRGGEAEADAAGGLGPPDRRSTAARARPHSGKLAGYVPETVPEETGPEAGSSAADAGGDTEEAGRPASPEGKAPEASRALPATPRAFALYPRSFSVEGREIPFSVYREPEGAGPDEHRMKRKDDNLSLPCVIGSSGSFSQRSALPCSGTSTPSSVVDIPPPFDLACITKKPVTKSSPSLLLESDSPDKQAAKKKKSSFKRFLALTFKRRTESRGHGEASLSSSRSSSESSYHGPCRVLDADRGSLGSSPQLKSRTARLRAAESPSSLLFYRDGKRKGVPFGRAVSRVESFEDRSRPAFLPLPLTKPRSISFPNADTSDYENIPAASSDYENIQIPARRPARAGTFAKLFEEQGGALSTASENDGYVDMSSFHAFETRQDPEAESAYTEPYKVCPMATAAPREDLASDDAQGTSEEEEGAPGDPGLTHKGEGPSRALVIARELLSSEKAYVQMLQDLRLEFHGAVTRALDDTDQEGRDSAARAELRQGLSALPAIHELHRGVLEELEGRLANWEEQQKVADVFLAREEEFEHHATHILQFDRCLGLLAETCLCSPRLANAVREFEQSQRGGGLSVRHRLLRVVQRLFQYQVLLTDYLNNLCPDSAEYDNTQGALTLISKVTDRASDSMEQGENLQKLVHIQHSVRGQEDLLQPGREFLKEGTLMKIRGKNRHPRHLFLLSDVLLYTYPQKDGKYRLKSSLAVAGMKVSRPVLEKVPYALKIETPESCLLLSASSCAERDEWYGCLHRALPEDCKAQALAAFQHSAEVRERLGVSLGERPPTLVPVSHVMMCMNCGCDFSLTLRRHHCQACGKIVCRNCSRNKYPLKYLKDRMAKVCDGCFSELRKRGGAVPGPLRERPLSMSFPLNSPRFSSGSALSSVFHSINPSAFRKQKKVPSALSEVAASGEGCAISGYLSRCKRGRRPWKKLWFVVKGKVLYTYVASEDKVALESMPLLGFTIAPDKDERSGEVGPAFHLYHKKTLFYSFKAEDTSSAQRWVKAMEDASVL